MDKKPSTKLPEAPSALLRLRMRQILLLAQLGAQRNLGRAAQALHMSQPSATKLLRQIEDTMAVPLFTRLPRGMEPTVYGEAMLRYARQVLTDFSLVREEIAALAGGLNGTLRIGCVPGAMPDLVAPALLAYRAHHPGVAVSVLVETSDVMLELLGQGQVDLVVGRLTEGHFADTFDCLELLAEPQVVVVRAGHPLLRKRRITLADLVHWPWILQPPGSPQRRRFEALLREGGVHARLDITETASTIATTALLAQSDMAAVMPASLAGHYGRLGILRVLKFELGLRVPAIQLLTRRHHVLSSAALAFAAELRRPARPPRLSRVAGR